MRNKFLIPKMAVIQEIGMRNKFLKDKVRDIMYCICVPACLSSPLVLRFGRVELRKLRIRCGRL
jgi:hypothetical protein